MSIIIDMNQITIANLMAESKGQPQFNEELVRHMVLNTLRSLRVKFRTKYGNEMILCYDGPDQWRKKIFPYYKASRKAKRENDDFPWDKLFDLLATLRQEIQENFPYKVLHLNGCEGDDLIAVISRNIASDQNPVLIVSSDNDFQQLLDNPNIHQYAHIKKSMVSCPDPKRYLFDHVLDGDVQDGIPNVLSDSDTFVNPEKRQKPLTKKKIAMFDPVTYAPEFGAPPEYTTNVSRNRSLIDFSYIPKEIQESIMSHYLETKIASGKLFSYLMTHKMTNLIACASEF